jgi:hypothetical protein
MAGVIRIFIDMKYAHQIPDSLTAVHRLSMLDADADRAIERLSF